MQEETRQHGDKHTQKAAFLKKSLSFRSRFMIGVAVSFVFVCIVGAYWIYEWEKKQLKEYAYDKTQLVMAAVEASRKYIREELRPVMYEEFGRDFFLLQAMSTSYVGRAVMDNFNQVLPQYEYRRVAENARNPDSEANTLEKSMINHFQKNPKLQNWQGMLQVKDQQQFMRFKPVYFKKSCMNCHGRPEEAPSELLKRYGSQKGFGNKPGELAGVMAVGIPVQNALLEIKDRAASVFLVLFAGAVFLYLVLFFIFNRVVLNNLRGVLHVFKEELEDKSLQDFLPAKDPHQGGDELQELSEAAVTMSEHLHRTKQELKQYAQNLEQKVALRTRALQKSEQLLQNKVQARNRELKTLNRISELTTQALGLKDVWPRVLQQGLELIPAQGAGVYLFQEEDALLKLQYQENALQLPETVSAQNGCQQEWNQTDQQLSASICQALDGLLSSVTDQAQLKCLNIPMFCRGKVLGVLSFVGLKDSPVTREQEELLLSVGRQAGIAVQSLREISEQKKVEQKIQQTEKLVALGQLASGVAHEINNPLGIILCYVELLKRQVAELPQGMQDLEMVEKQVINCKQIVTDLLQFSRRQESVKEMSSINNIIQEAAQMFKHQFRKNNIELQLDLEPGLPEIRINADKIKQVLVNLLMNALQAVPDQGLIQVCSGLEPGQERVWVSVRDNGQGVQESIKDKIFDPFFSTKSTKEGTGLGLSVSYGIVQDHGGEIKLKSEKGQWSRFIVFLPLRPELQQGEEYV